MRPSPTNCFQILLLRHRPADALYAEPLLSSLYFRFDLAAHPSLTIIRRSSADFLSRRIRLIYLMPLLPAIQLTHRSASHLFKSNLIPLSSASRSTSASSFAARSWLVPLLPSPHNARSCCGCAQLVLCFLSSRRRSRQHRTGLRGPHAAAHKPSPNP